MNRPVLMEGLTPVRGTDDYLISESGRIFSNKRGSWKELHPYLGENGYLYINLRFNMQTVREYIHRLVAETYIPNPYNKKVVNHIDGNKLNNHISNLEWVTFKENSLHAYHTGLNHMPDMCVIIESIRKPVRATNIDTGEVIDFYSQAEAANYIGVDRSHLNMALRGRCSHAKRWMFEYLEKEGDRYN